MRHEAERRAEPRGELAVLDEQRVGLLVALWVPVVLQAELLVALRVLVVLQVELRDAPPVLVVLQAELLVAPVRDAERASLLCVPRALAEFPGEPVGRHALERRGELPSELGVLGELRVAPAAGSFCSRAVAWPALPDARLAGDARGLQPVAALPLLPEQPERAAPGPCMSSQEDATLPTPRDAGGSPLQIALDSSKLPAHAALEQLLARFAPHASPLIPEA